MPYATRFHVNIKISLSEQSQENYVLKLNSDLTGQILYFFGAKHTNNPNDAQFNHLKKLFEEFLKIAKGEKIIFTEGAIHETLQDYEEAIRQQGEIGAIQWLGNEADIEMICPEPSSSEQRKALCLSFDPQIVAYAMVTQNLAGWFRHTRQSSFEEATNRSLSREAQFSEIYGFMPDRDWLYDQHKKLFREQLLEDKNFLDSISDPRQDDTQINAIITARTEIRNNYLFSRIAEAWKMGKSILVVYGKGHLDDLETKLSTLVS